VGKRKCYYRWYINVLRDGGGGEEEWEEEIGIIGTIKLIAEVINKRGRVR
jgi:hypothetical protein